MAQVLAIKPGRLKAAERKALASVDIIVLELDDTSELRLIQVEGTELASSEMTWAALEAIDSCGISTTAERFVKNVRALVTKKLQRQAGTTEQPA